MQIKPTLKKAHEALVSDPADDQSTHVYVHSKPVVGPLPIKKVLVPIDFSDCALRALDYAVAFAEPLGASIVLLNVVEPAVGTENYLSLTPTFDETNEQLVEAGRERLQTLCRKRLGCHGCESLVRIGRAPSEIADTANALGADMIIMGTHGRSGLEHAPLGSTTEKVVRQASCPVLTVRCGK